MYNIDWLILKTISEEKSISKAAGKLYISQPAITYRLKNLESELNAKLIIRTPRGITFTPQGVEVLNYANKSLQDFQRLTDSLDCLANTPQGTLSIGASRIFANQEFSPLLKTFLTKYPQVKIYLKTDLSSNIYKLLQKDEINIAIIRGDYNWEGINVFLKDEPICLVADQPLLMEDLPKLPFINSTSSIQNLIETWWSQNFTEAPYITSHVDSMDTCRQMVIHGLGWSIMPFIGLPNDKSLFIKPLFFKNGKPLHRPTRILYRKAYQNLPSLMAFVKHMKATCHQ